MLHLQDHWEMVVQAHGQPLLMTLLFPLILGFCGFPLILLGLHIFDKHCCYINQGYCFSLCHGQHYLLCPCYFWRFLPPSNSSGEFAASWKGSDPLPHGRPRLLYQMLHPINCLLPHHFTGPQHYLHYCWCCLLPRSLLPC